MVPVTNKILNHLGWLQFHCMAGRPASCSQLTDSSFGAGRGLQITWSLQRMFVHPNCGVAKTHKGRCHHPECLGTSVPALFTVCYVCFKRLPSCRAPANRESVVFSFLCTTNLNNLESCKKNQMSELHLYFQKKTGDLLIYYDSRRRISFQQLQFNIISVQKCMFHPKVSEASPRRSEHTLETARSFEAPEKITATEQKYDQIFQGKKLSKFRIIKVVLVEKSGD